MVETPVKSPDAPANNIKTDDKLLVKRFNQGDGTVFDRIVESYSADIATLANRLLGWTGDVEDIVQDVFLLAFLHLKKFRCDCSLRSWLFTITINKCRSHRFKLLRLRSFKKKLENTACNWEKSADKNPVQKETFEQVQQAVKKLPLKYREPVVLRYLNELPIENICQILGISKNTLDVRLNRARKRLKNNLSGLIEE